MNELISTVVVTGGSRGIGRVVAEELALCGFQVYLTYVSKSEEAQAVVSAIRSRGGQAAAFALNVGNSEEVGEFFATEIKDKVHLAALVNNAGITKDGFLIRMKDDDFASVLDTNLKGAFFCLREAAKIMSKQRAGSIVNMTSVVGQMGNACQANYAAAKAGLIGLTKSAAKELASRNITVNAVAPGFIETDMTAVLPEDVKKGYIGAIPLGRFGTAEDVANLVSFLISPKASYITGQVIGINGGLYC